MPGLLGQIDRERARRRHRREQRDPGHRRLLRQLEARPAGHEQHVPGERQPAARGPPSRSPCRPRCAGRRPRAAPGGHRSAREQAGRVQPAGRGRTYVCASRSRPAASRASSRPRSIASAATSYGDLRAYGVDAGLAAHAAGAGGVEVPGRVDLGAGTSAPSATSTTLYVFGSSVAGAQLRGAARRRRDAMIPSVSRKPIARSMSCPGVRMVTASGGLG